MEMVSMSWLVHSVLNKSISFDPFFLVKISKDLKDWNTALVARMIRATSLLFVEETFYIFTDNGTYTSKDGFYLNIYKKELFNFFIRD